jgi:hypothetical protein
LYFTLAAVAGFDVWAVGFEAPVARSKTHQGLFIFPCIMISLAHIFAKFMGMENPMLY